MEQPIHEEEIEPRPQLRFLRHWQRHALQQLRRVQERQGDHLAQGPRDRARSEERHEQPGLEQAHDHVCLQFRQIGLGKKIWFLIEIIILAILLTVCPMCVFG